MKKRVWHKWDCLSTHSLQTLQVDQLEILAPQRDQLAVSAPFDHAALVNDVDDICLLDGAETVGDGDSGAASGGLVQRGLDHFFGFRVQGRSGLVE